MTELHGPLSAALEQIHDDWDAARTERNLYGVHARLQRWRRRRAVAAGGGVCLAIAAVWALIAWPRSQPAPGAQLVATTSSRLMHFADGSQLELLDASARIVVDEVTRERVAVSLLEGRVRVAVVPRPERTFRVRAGDVVVEVLGTAFEVTLDGKRTHVAVLRGRVAVHWGAESTPLSAGEAGWFPKISLQPLAANADQPEAAAGSRVATKGERAASPTRHTRARPASELARAESTPQPTAADRAAASAAETRHAREREPRAAGDTTWQVTAERGDYTRAYELMAKAPERVSDDVEELLLAADAARLSGHPAQALPYLRRVIEQHPRDPRAPLAAFTLASVLLNQLDRPREAEAAYAHARSLTLSPALAQDALARQIECAHRSGDNARTRELAREYLSRYPDGRRAHWVRELSDP